VGKLDFLPMDKGKAADQNLLPKVPAGGPNPSPVPPDRLYAFNNFDLIRLLAALQVAFHHLLEQLKVEPSGFIITSIYKITLLFPGVPIFFFISGFLISKSYENTPRLPSYAKNRILRIYPALIFCVMLSIISVLLSGYFNVIEIPIAKFIFWIFSQITIPGFYNPDFMRGYGAGVLDGPVWTISVELQLYILVPIIYILVARLKKDLNRIIIILVIIFAIINYTYSLVHDNEIIRKEVWFKLIGLSFLPWFYMFLLGVLFQINFIRIYNYLNDKLIYPLGIYLLIYYPLHEIYSIRGGNLVNPLIFLLLSMVVFSFAYSYKNISNKLIKHNDISYGIYLYHMPVCNWFINIGWLHNVVYVLISIVLSSIFSYISWIVVEKPALLLKKYSINPINWKYRLAGR
jgi:peptidoglycan/LPS O-acetylase OafA/YrhL